MTQNESSNRNDKTPKTLSKYFEKMNNEVWYPKMVENRIKKFEYRATISKRKPPIKKTCDKYKMGGKKPSPEIFDTIICFTKFEVSMH